MSVLLIIRNEKELTHLPCWALTIAKAKKSALKIAVLNKAKKANEPKILDNNDKISEKQLLWHRKICESLNSDPLPSYALASNQPEENDKKSQDDRIIVSIYQREHHDLARAALMFAHKEKASLVILGRFDQEKTDHFSSQLLRDLPSPVLLLKPTTPPQPPATNIMVVASPGPNTPGSIKLAVAIAKSMGMSKLCALNLEPLAGDDAEPIAKKQIENLAKSAKVDIDFLEIRNATAGPLQSALIESSNHQPFQLILLGSTERGILQKLLFGNRDSEIIHLSKKQSIGIFRDAIPMAKLTRRWLDRTLSKYIPQMDREGRISLFAALQSGSYWNLDFIALISLSSAIASLGLIQNSPAIVIGAMLVAPLMTPMIGAGLGLVQGNIRLVATAAKTISFGFLVSLTIGIIFGFATGIKTSTNEIMARGEPNLLDLFVAFFSGTAAAYATSRPNLSGALPGVAIAAALVPPITSAGISLVTGDFAISRGAATLFGVNLLVIILAAALTLYSVGARPDSQQRQALVWVKRVFIGLLSATLAITLPLATEVFQNFSKRKNLGNLIAGKIPDQTITLRNYHFEDNQLIIQLETERKIKKSEMAPLIDALKSQLSSDIKITIETEKVLRF